MTGIDVMGFGDPSNEVCSGYPDHSVYLITWVSAESLLAPWDVS